ncbi:unnamed protein product [Lampetra planeri]
MEEAGAQAAELAPQSRHSFCAAAEGEAFGPREEEEDTRRLKCPPGAAAHNNPPSNEWPLSLLQTISSLCPASAARSDQVTHPQRGV